jgi:hypothetical protein
MIRKLNKMTVRILMLGVFGIVVAGTALGQDGSKGGRLVGTWDAAVRVTDCSTGAQVATFNSIASFNQGGTSIGSTGGIPQSMRTPEHGIWRHIKGNTYSFKFKTFSFLPTGAPNGWSIVEHEVVLDQDNNSYTSSGTSRIFDQNGVQTLQRCSTAVGTRFEF